MFVPAAIKNAVVFLGSPGEEPNATGFVVSHPIDPEGLTPYVRDILRMLADVTGSTTAEN